MKNLLNSIQVKKEKSNVFDLSHDVKLSLNMGWLVPSMVKECVPGDKWSLSAESMARLQALIAPMMHRVDVRHEYFFVPYRLLWDKWEMFISDKKDPVLPPAFPTLTINNANYALGGLSDYLGIPIPQPDSSEIVSAMPYAAYQMIFQEYYRDQNLVADVPYKLIDGSNNANAAQLLALRRRAWEHDYFTASLPFAQKGDPVSMPIELENAELKFSFDNPAAEMQIVTDLDGITTGIEVPTEDVDDIPSSRFFADTSGMTANTTINDLRRSNALQRFREKLARGGSRYTELIYSMFGIKSPDARLQRPEYITGVKAPIVISEVLNTTGTEEAPQGNMAGHGIAVMQGKFGHYNVMEYGMVMCITSVVPRTCYQQGIDKMFLKTSSPYEYFFPDFAHIGEQEVKCKELYAFQGGDGENTFGYVPRYAEYKVAHSRVCGDFRDTLAFWHMGRIFNDANDATLSGDFVTCTPREDVFAVQDEGVDKILMHIQHRVRVVRKMPKFGTPSW